MKPKPAREYPNPETKPQCEAISQLDEPCNKTAEILCDKCQRWFCAAHLQDDLWHACELEPGDEGGEA